VPAEKSGVSSVPGLVKDLVNQFDRPLDFIRELIQNAIDSGSNRVDITLEHLPKDSQHPALAGLPPSESGWALLCLEDDGEGMDERVIDEYLLVLFRSSKEQDFTKIGKFGIGFVSVFALQPQRVRLHTARGGESWRLDFPSYERYDKYRVRTMREGTLVEVVKAVPRAEYDQLCADARKAVTNWCRHSEAKLFFTDRTAGVGPDLLSEPFDLPGGHTLRYEEEGTALVLGFSGEEKPFCGFYNRGLTLEEGAEAHFPGVEFKANSRYIEHTLTRDTILKDENYDKLMKTMRRLVEKELPSKLRSDLEEASKRIARRVCEGRGPEDYQAELEVWRRRALFLQRLYSGLFSRWGRESWPLFPALDGRVLSLSELRRAAEKSRGWLYFDSSRNAVTAELEKRGFTVLAAGSWVAPLSGWLGVKTAQASQAFILPTLLDDSQVPEARTFLESLRALDAWQGPKYRAILPADFGYPGSCLSDELFVTQREPGVLSPAHEKPSATLLGRLFGGRPTCLLNTKHPSAQALARLHAKRPRLAAFLASKALRLLDGRQPSNLKGVRSNLTQGEERRLLEAALSEAQA